MAKDILEDLTPIYAELDGIINMGFPDFQVFVDWVAIMFYSFQLNDSKYIEILGKYTNNPENPKEKEAQYFAGATAKLMQYILRNNQEVLSVIFSHYLQNSQREHIFTPYMVSSLMAKLALGNLVNNKTMIIKDNSCGAGVMLIEASKNMSIDARNKTYFIGIDSDINCVRMTALNMMFFNLNSYIIWGDVLLSEYKEAWATSRDTTLGGNLYKVDMGDVEKYL